MARRGGQPGRKPDGWDGWMVIYAVLIVILLGVAIAALAAALANGPS